MEVLLVTPHWPPRSSGHGDYSWHLAHALAEAGATVSVLVLGQEEVTPSQRLDVRVGSGPFPDRLTSLLIVSRTIAEARPTVVCLQFEANAYRLKATPHLLPLLLRARGLRVVLMYHELWAPRRLGRLAKLLLLNAPNRVATFSDWHAQGVQRFRRIGRTTDIIAVASNVPGPSEGDRRLLRARYGFGVDDRIITSFGFISPEHGLHNLLHAFAEARARSSHVLLSVIGGFDPERNGYHQRLKALSRELQLDDAITWHGRVAAAADVARLLAISDVGVLLYDTGVGENNGAFVAMAQFGLPIITTRGERSALMEDEELAVFVDPACVELRDALVSTLEHPERAAGMGVRARDWADRRNWSSLAGAFLRVFDPDSPTERLL